MNAVWIALVIKISTASAILASQVPGEKLAHFSKARGLVVPLLTARLRRGAGAVSIFIPAQKKGHVVVGFPLGRKIELFRNIIRLSFQACPLQGMGEASARDNP